MSITFSNELRIPGLDFVAFDVETANRVRGSVCAIGLCVVRDGQIADRYSWLCQPPVGIDSFDRLNVSLHGIDATTVSSAPPFAERLEEMVDVVGGLTLVAHNASFDLAAVREACTASDLRWPELSYGCTLVMARRSLDLISYRLPLVAAALGLPQLRHHDACADAEMAARITLALANRQGITSVSELLGSLGCTLGRLSPSTWTGSRAMVSRTATSMLLPAADLDTDPAHPLYGQTIAFTGGLHITRAEAWDRVAAAGATPSKSVTGETTMLVIGDGFRGNAPEDFTTAKAAKAAQLRAKGQAIEVFTEGDLFALLYEPLPPSSPASS